MLAGSRRVTLALRQLVYYPSRMARPHHIKLGRRIPREHVVRRPLQPIVVGVVGAVGSSGRGTWVASPSEAALPVPA